MFTICFTFPQSFAGITLDPLDAEADFSAYGDPRADNAEIITCEAMRFRDPEDGWMECSEATRRITENWIWTQAALAREIEHRAVDEISRPVIRMLSGSCLRASL